MRNTLRRAATAPALVALSGTALAQAWPAQPIRFARLPCFAMPERCTPPR